MAMTPRTWSISALAVELGADRRTIAAAVRDVQPAAQGAKGPEWRLADVLRAMRGGPSGGTPDLEEARARKLAAEAELAEIAVAKARGALVEIDAVARAVSEEYAATRAKLLSLPSKIGPMVAIETSATACQELIERGIVEALEELSRDGDILADGTADGDRAGSRGQLEATAEADDQRVG